MNNCKCKHHMHNVEKPKPPSGRALREGSHQYYENGERILPEPPSKQYIQHKAPSPIKNGYKFLFQLFTKFKR